MRRNSILSLSLVLLLGSLVLGGCATGKIHQATSVVDYLYTNEHDASAKPGVPKLELPLRIGIAFVPSIQPAQSSHSFLAFPTFNSGYALTEQQKMDLMLKVANHFKKYPFVDTIELIPSAYLTPRGGFANLSELHTMYGIDVIALLSYDQAQFTDESALSLTYLTVVGAYVVPGEKNDTHTMLDAAVYDIPSHKLLFRAPGTSQIRGRATLANLSEQRREHGEAGFKQAAAKMIENLDQQLALFRRRAEARPDVYKIVRPPNYDPNALRQ